MFPSLAHKVFCHIEALAVDTFHQSQSFVVIFFVFPSTFAHIKPAYSSSQLANFSVSTMFVRILRSSLMVLLEFRDISAMRSQEYHIL